MGDSTDVKAEYNSPNDRFGWASVGQAYIIYDRIRDHYVTGDHLPTLLTEAKQQARLCNIAATRAIQDLLQHANKALHETALVKAGIHG